MSKFDFNREKLGSQITSELEVQDDGESVLHKRSIPDRELTPMELVVQAEVLDHRIDDKEENIEELEDQLEAQRDALENLRSIREDFDEVIKECQDHVYDGIRERIDNVKDSVEQRVREEYNWDQAITREKNRKQLLQQYQTYIMRRDELDAFPMNYVREVVQDEGYAGNPFQNAMQRSFE